MFILMNNSFDLLCNLFIRSFAQESRVYPGNPGHEYTLEVYFSPVALTAHLTKTLKSLGQKTRTVFSQRGRADWVIRRSFGVRPNALHTFYESAVLSMCAAKAASMEKTPTRLSGRQLNPGLSGEDAGQALGSQHIHIHFYTSE